MSRPSYGRFTDGTNTPTEILASTEGLEKLGCELDNTAVAVAASYTTSGGAANSHLTFTAVDAGDIGNHVEVVITDTDQAVLSVSVADGVVTIDLDTDTGTPISTATEVAAAVAASAAASALLTCVVKAGETGAGVVAAMAQTNLAGGTDAQTPTSWVKGTIMAIVTATGLWVPYDDDGTDDGRRVAKGILQDTYDASLTDQNDLRLNAVVYIHGSFVEANLTGLDANGKTDLGGRSIGTVFTF